MTANSLIGCLKVALHDTRGFLEKESQCGPAPASGSARTRPSRIETESASAFMSCGAGIKPGARRTPDPACGATDAAQTNRGNVNAESNMNADERDDGLHEIVMEVVLDAGDNGITTFDKLLEKAAVGLEKRAGLAAGPHPFSIGPASRLPPGDSEFVLETAWDLVRRGIVTFCPDSSSPSWPGLRRSRFGERAARSGPDRLGDDKGLMKALPLQPADVSHDARVYLEEAVRAFYMDRLLSTCVLLALAAEGEFLRLLSEARTSAAFGRHFARIADGQTVRAKIAQFKDAMNSIRAELPKSATEELEHNLEAIQCVIRAARNDSGAPLSRDQVYLHLQVFVPFAKQAKRLRQELNERPYPRLVRLH
jgi:hypothetical protein